MEVVYKESIGIKMNDLDLCLEVVQRFKVMSTIAASISPKLPQLETSNLAHDFVWPVMPSGRTNNYP